MRSECFLDTNVLIYAAAGKTEAPRKYDVARRLVSDTAFCVSAQVLGEFFVVAQKFQIALPPADVDAWIDLLAKYPVAFVDVELVQRGVVIPRENKIKYYDAALIAAAERLGAPIVYTEDLSHRQRYGLVQVVNPFRPD